MYFITCVTMRLILNQVCTLDSLAVLPGALSHIDCRSCYGRVYIRSIGPCLSDSSLGGLVLVGYYLTLPWQPPGASAGFQIVPTPPTPPRLSLTPHSSSTRAAEGPRPFFFFFSQVLFLLNCREFLYDSLCAQTSIT